MGGSEVISASCQTLPTDRFIRLDLVSCYNYPKNNMFTTDLIVFNGGCKHFTMLKINIK